MTPPLSPYMCTMYMNVRERGEVMYYNFPELRVSQNTETVQSLHNRVDALFSIYYVIVP